MNQLYSIYYPNHGFSQVKRLIPHSEWLYSKTLSENKQKAHLAHISGGNEWFTEQSPFYNAIHTGLLVHYGGISPVVITVL